MPFPRKVGARGAEGCLALPGMAPLAGRWHRQHLCPERPAGGHASQQPCFAGTDAFRYNIWNVLNLPGAASLHVAQRSIFKTFPELQGLGSFPWRAK